MTWDFIYVRMVMLKVVAKIENGRGTDAGWRLFLCSAAAKPAPEHRVLASFSPEIKKEEFA